MTKYRIRKSFFRKCILQRWASFPQSLPNAPMSHWVDVDWDSSPYEMQCFSLECNIDKRKEEATA